MKDQRDQPVRLIEKATKALQSIDRTNKHFRETKVKEMMGKLAAVVELDPKRVKLNSKLVVYRVTYDQIKIRQE